MPYFWFRNDAAFSHQNLTVFFFLFTGMLGIMRIKVFLQKEKVGLMFS